jgi:predicted phosphoribosyltransferase
MDGAGEVTMYVVFSDRQEAGRQLATRLKYLAGRPNLVVLGLPRGGVPVAAEVAKALGAPLDVFVVRKLGVPGEEELAMGAVASGGIRVINSDVVTALRISPQVLDQVTAAEQRELDRRDQAYRQGRPFPDLRNATVVLVDDGVATGSTMLAAIRALRQQGPATLVAAAPVMSVSARADLAREADACVCVATPEPFRGVGAWYRDFSQTSDAEVLGLLGPAGPSASPAGPVAGGDPSLPDPGKGVARASHS